MDLDPILRPRSLAVVGYSHSNPFHPANVIYHKNHLRYDARCFAVNPRGGEVYGETVYPRIGDIPGGVDQAVLVVRSDLVPGLVRECAEAGVRGLVVISGGFAETGRTELQAALTTAAHDTGLPVIGPNCLGVYAPPMCDSFFLPYERLVEPRAGNVALVSQSGGILVDLIIKLTQERVGLSSAVSIGNKAVVDEVDLLEYFLADEQTQVIGIYLEGFSRGRGRRFVELARSAAKPIVALKAGKTPGGSRAVSSHTASLAGDYRVFRDL
ncbi:MAG: CoA-binding protein, partial [Myxococcota bacterium]|nr:CoA-binding protein [Myxococcota bacterium]